MRGVEGVFTPEMVTGGNEGLVVGKFRLKLHPGPPAGGQLWVPMTVSVPSVACTVRGPQLGGPVVVATKLTEVQ
jgi:hypothetical protein